VDQIRRVAAFGMSIWYWLAIEFFKIFYFYTGSMIFSSKTRIDSPYVWEFLCSLSCVIDWRSFMMGLGQAEKNCTLYIQMYSCLYFTLQQPGMYHRKASRKLLCSNWFIWWPKITDQLLISFPYHLLMWFPNNLLTTSSPSEKTMVKQNCF
jgi:hypothetical protein